MPQEHERAKYAELFAVLFIRTCSSTLKESFKSMKAIIDQKAQVSPVEMYTVIDFYLRCSLEAVSMVKRSLSSKLDFYDDKIMILWGVYSRTPILEVINGVLQLLLND